MIKTSYFSKYKGNAGCSLYSDVPKNYKGAICSQLFAPISLDAWYAHHLSEIPTDNVDEFIARRKLLRESYAEQYCEHVLNRLDVHDVAKALDGKVLLGIVKSGKFCTRHLVAQWLSSHGYKCEELIYKHELKSGK